MKIYDYIKEYGIKSKIMPSFYSRTKNYEKMHEYYLKYIEKHYGYIYEKYKDYDKKVILLAINTMNGQQKMVLFFVYTIDHYMNCVWLVY